MKLTPFPDPIQRPSLALTGDQQVSVCADRTGHSQELRDLDYELLLKQYEVDMVRVCVCACACVCVCRPRQGIAGWRPASKCVCVHVDRDDCRPVFSLHVFSLHVFRVWTAFQWCVNRDCMHFKKVHSCIPFTCVGLMKVCLSD